MLMHISWDMLYKEYVTAVTQMFNSLAPDKMAEIMYAENIFKCISWK